MTTYVEQDSSSNALGIVLLIVIAAAIIAGIWYFSKQPVTTGPSTIIERNVTVPAPTAPSAPAVPEPAPSTK